MSDETAATASNEKRYRWYFWASLLLWLAFLAIALGPSLSLTLFQAQWALELLRAHDSPYPWIICVSFCAALFWSCWAHSVLAAGEPPGERLTPKRRSASLQTRVWVPAALPVLFDIAVGIVIIIVKIHGEAPDLTSEVLLTFAIPIAITLVLTVPSVFISKWVDRRYRANIERRSRCFHCGYDLSAASSVSCPECGEPVPESILQQITPRSPSENV